MTTKRRTNKEKVLARYPNAVCTGLKKFTVWSKYDSGAHILGGGLSPEDAWVEAAARLKGKK